jgi:hypothetical protein
MDFTHSVIFSDPFITGVALAILGMATWLGKQIASAIADWRARANHDLTSEQFKTLIEIAKLAVATAEQLGVGAFAEEKKAKALQVVNTYLKLYDIPVTAEQIDAALEAAVWTELNQWKVQTPPLEGGVAESIPVPAI